MIEGTGTALISSMVITGYGVPDRYETAVAPDQFHVRGWGDPDRLEQLCVDARRQGVEVAEILAMAMADLDLRDRDHADVAAHVGLSRRVSADQKRSGYARGRQLGPKTKRPQYGLRATRMR